MLLIANSQNILATYLSGAQVSTITPTSTRQTTAMDFSYANETVCWVHVGDSAAQTQLKCARMPGLKGFVDEHTNNMSLSLHRESPAPARRAGEGRGECKPRFCNRSRDETSDKLGINQCSTFWSLSLHPSSLAWVLGGVGKRPVA